MTAPMLESAHAFAFGRFLLIPEQGLLLDDQVAVRIGRRAFDVLVLLVTAHGQVVSKQTLLSRCWPGLVVEEGNLKVHIAGLRRLLGDGAGADEQRHIATVVGRGYRFVAPVRPAFPQLPGNLPQPPAQIFGRATVIDAIVEDLQATRLVSVVGPGGIGKSTVALAAANQAGGAYKDGCWLVDLSGVGQADGVASAIAAVTSLRADQQHMLLVLDNCEHLVGAVAQWVDQLLARTRNVACIVTSREPLCIRGERVRRLPGLALPPPVAGYTAAAALAFPAVQLFVARARAHCAHFALDDTNATHVSAICRRLDGVALAIERVAQRAGTLGVASLLEHLERRFHMFDGYHAGPARHRTLTATVHTSYRLLSPGEQATLRRLAGFPGAFSLEAACALCCGPDTDPSAVLEDIASLVAKSLLLAEPCGDAMAYRQTHVTRAYAARTGKPDE